MDWDYYPTLCINIYQTAPIGRIRMEKEDFDLLFFNTF